MDAADTYATSQFPETELEEGEEILIQGFGKNEHLWLSNYRVMQWSPKSLLGRTAKLGQIPLESINEISIGFVRHTELLVLGVVTVLLAAMARVVLPNSLADVLWLIGIVATISYVVSGRRVVVVKSPTEQLKIRTSKVKADEVRNFIFTLEDARNSLMGIEGDAEDAGNRAGGVER
jgi:hypothetical protein|tara:strand:- start:128 stop:658 length:531 start_codon:yes stop_codon:yes gene_type:complete